MLRAWMLCMALGIASVAWLPRLPAFSALAIVGLGLVVGARIYRRRWWSCLLAVLLGVAWGSAYGTYIRAGILPFELEQQELALRGRVIGLVETSVGFQQKPVLRFQLDVEGCTDPDGAECAQTPRRVQLSWYETDSAPAPGERWQLAVKLKRPRGFANPGGFDFEAWQVANRIGAVGYVARSAGNQRLQAASRWSVDAWRGRAHDYLQQRLSQAAHRDLLLGLLVGDGSDISQAEWKTFRATGTIHLFVVSGLQIALTGGLVLGFSRLCWRSPWAVSTRRAYWLGIAPAFLVACLYAALAGFGLPIQRALIMFALLLWTLAARREIRAASAWIAALWLVLLFDPLAVIDAGFWFSFVVVGVLLIAVVGRREARPSRWRWWRAQWSVFVASLPVLIVLSGQFTLLALPANLVAIPLSTLLSMPLAFLALLADLFTSALGDRLWHWADLSLDWLCLFLRWLEAQGALLIWHVAGAGAVSVLAAVLFALLMLMPRGFPGRAYAWVFLLPVLWPQLAPIAPGAGRVTVIDVGQGLGVLVETAQHRLLYDTGPPFGPERTVAELAITPLLRQHGISHLDAVVVSHRDSDHAGGWPEINREFAVQRLLVGEDIGASNAESCKADTHWQWDGVMFELLYPQTDNAAKGNDASCVLQIHIGDNTILLPGDIERAAEWKLLAAERLQPITLLLAPHHGSKSSSTAAFVEHTQPRYVVFSSGYRNRYHHPHPSVEQRYQQAGATLFNTATDGALIFEFGATPVPQITQQRSHLQHYWD